MKKKNNNSGMNNGKQTNIYAHVCIFIKIYVRVNCTVRRAIATGKSEQIINITSFAIECMNIMNIFIYEAGTDGLTGDSVNDLLVFSLSFIACECTVK